MVFITHTNIRYIFPCTIIESAVRNKKNAQWFFIVVNPCSYQWTAAKHRHNTKTKSLTWTDTLLFSQPTKNKRRASHHMQLHKYQWLLQPRGVPGWVWVVHLCSDTMWYPHGMNMNHVAKAEKSSSSLPNCYLLGRGNVDSGQYTATFQDGWQQSRVILTTKDTISCSIFSYRDTSTYNRFFFKIEKTSCKSQISKNSSWSVADFQFFQSNQQPSNPPGTKNEWLFSH